MYQVKQPHISATSSRTGGASRSSSASIGTPLLGNVAALVLAGVAPRFALPFASRESFRVVLFYHHAARHIYSTTA